MTLNAWAAMLRNADNLPWLDRIQDQKSLWGQWAKITQAVRPAAENENPDPAQWQILLELYLLIGGYNPVESRCLRGCQQGAILQPREFGVRRGLAVVRRKKQAEALVHAFVDQDEHQTRERRRAFDSSST